MSRYAYGYSVVPARPKGWRSAAGNLFGVSAVVLLSGISGAVVAFDLIGGDARVVPAPVSAAAPARPDIAQAPVQAPIKLPTKTPTQISAAPSVAPVVAAAAENPKPTQRAEAPAVVAPVTAPPAAPQPAPAQLSQNDDAAISASDLTFAKGYALRRAARQAAAAQAQKPAATNAAAPNAKVAAASEQPVVATEKQFGRRAVPKRKPSVVAQYPRNDRYGAFERFDGPTRHQALAYGDSSRPVRRMNSGGWFDGLF